MNTEEKKAGIPRGIIPTERKREHLHPAQAKPSTLSYPPLSLEARIPF